MTNRTLRAGFLRAKVFAWLYISFFIFCAVMSWRAGQGSVSPYFLLFACLGLLMILPASSLEMKSDLIRVNAPIGVFQMHWDKVQRVEEGANGTLVLHGPDDSWLVIPPVSFWSGKDKSEMVELMYSEFKKRKIHPSRIPFADYRFHKNVRVRAQ